MEAKTIIITGANAGIGYGTAMKLAQAKHHVIMICRNAKRGEIAREKIIAESQNNNVDLVLADLSSQRSIRDCAATVNSRYSHLDVLINNAANFDITQKKADITEDGVETIFATNHLGPFLLTHLLLPLLRVSKKSRVINIASKGLIAHPFLKIDFDNINGQKKFNPAAAYYHSKLAQVIYTYDLAEKLEGSGVTVNCIRVPAVQLDEGRFDHIPAFLRAIYRFKMSFSLTADQMADTYVNLAVNSDFDNVTGVYIDENSQHVKSSRHSYDREVWKKLWQVSEEMTGLQAPSLEKTL